MKKAAFTLFAALFALSSFAVSEVNVADFGAKPDGSDTTLAVRAALESCKKSGASRLVFPKGRYVFGPDAGAEKYLFLSNNDEGLKRIIFPIDGMEKLTIDGQGSEFVFQGFVNPFLVENSNGIKFENFSVDVARPFHSEGVIVESSDGSMVLRIPENFPYRVREGILEFIDDKGAIYQYGGLLEFDSQKRETAFMVGDYWTTGHLVAEDLGNRKVRIQHSSVRGTPGNIMVFAYEYRRHPAFIVDESKDVKFENITIYAAGGMGILGQNSRDIEVLNCKVTPAPGRVVSCTADATHFSNCEGKIVLKDNLFENQLDDATNIHGIYEKVERIVAPDKILTRLVHGQQFGFRTFKPGDKIELVRGKSMITYAENTVIDVETINKEFKLLTLKDELPETAVAGDAVAVIRDYPEITITGNYIGKNRARGMLLNCRGKTLVENNVFHAPGAAILFEGDACFWFEQGGVSDCTIRNNVFENCKFGVWGGAVIDVAAGVRENLDKSRYNKNIVIENNTFKVFDDVPLLNIYCVDGLKWRGNKIEKTSDYPAREFSGGVYKVSNSDNIEIEE